jgi:glyoxylate carboligase
VAETVADFVLHRLRESGVQRIYGYPGDGINGFLGALDRADGDPDFIQVRHEEMSALMACGHAKFTGEVGVCLATSGPGAIHLLNGLYDAKLDHAPVAEKMAKAMVKGDPEALGVMQKSLAAKFEGAPARGGRYGGTTPPLLVCRLTGRVESKDRSS